MPAGGRPSRIGADPESAVEQRGLVVPLQHLAAPDRAQQGRPAPAARPARTRRTARRNPADGVTATSPAFSCWCVDTVPRRHPGGKRIAERPGVRRVPEPQEALQKAAVMSDPECRLIPHADRHPIEGQHPKRRLTGLAEGVGKVQVHLRLDDELVHQQEGRVRYSGSATQKRLAATTSRRPESRMVAECFPRTRRCARPILPVPTQCSTGAELLIERVGDPPVAPFLVAPLLQPVPGLQARRSAHSPQRAPPEGGARTGFVCRPPPWRIATLRATHAVSR